jgi:penicillin-binding protein 1A
MRDETAFLMSSLLADVVNSGTGARARGLGFTLPAAGKTGTTSDFNDAWFVGYTPKLVAGVWIGFDEPRTIMPNGFASDVAVPLWANFMKRATHDDAPEWILTPANVTSVRICRLTGKLATPHCEHAEMAADGPDERRAAVYTEYFVRGTEPTTYCDRHDSPNLLAAIGALVSGRENPGVVEEGDAAPKGILDGSRVDEDSLPPQQKDDSRPPQQKHGKSIWSRLFSSGRN